MQTKANACPSDPMDLGQNVEDRHAAAIFDTASKMMTHCYYCPNS